MSDMQGKTCVVTGANAGIGKWTVIGLAERGARVLMHARSREKGEAAVAEVKGRTGNPEIELVVADLAELGQVAALAREVLERCPRLDVLVNNAGVIQGERTETPDGYESTFAVNHLAVFLLTNLLLERLRESAPSRVVTVASRAHVGRQLDFDDLQSERSYASMDVYGKSKLANILFTRELARRLQEQGADAATVTANCLHPGVVRTRFGADGDLGGLMGVGWALLQPFLLSPEKGARTSVFLASSQEVDGISGEYFDQCKIQRTTRYGRDPDSAAELWRRSTEMVAKWLPEGASTIG